ncbi:MAG: PKD domain-containing protein [Candidatus Methanofastidiosa archaeon]|nr:PKD domain-containing protein [Candidatus Methanofastidiosa archaeon]
MSDGVELYDNSIAVDISKSITKEIIIRFEDLPPCKIPPCGGGVIDGVDPPKKLVEEEKITESTIYTCNPLWKYTTKAETRVLAISDTSSYIIVGAGDTVYSLTKQGQLSWKYQTDSTINYIATKGSFVAVASQKTVYLFKINGDQMWTFSTGGIPEVLAVTSTGPYVGVGTSTGNIYFIGPDGQKDWEYKNKSGVEAMDVTNKGDYLAAGSKDNNVLYFNDIGTKLWSYKTNGPVNYVSLSPQGQFIAAGADRDGYYLFNWNGKKLWGSTNKEVYFWAIHVADDGKWLLGGVGKFMGGSTEMRISNRVCFFNTEDVASAGDAPDKNTEVQTTTPPPETTTSGANKFPQANAGSDLEAKVGDAIHFDGTKSIDEDGIIVAYKWDFGDGTSSNDAEPLHQYTNPGTYKVTLTVTDNKGDTGQDVLYTTVKSAEPQSPIKGVPGFELPTVLGGSAFAYYLLYKRKRK